MEEDEPAVPDPTADDSSSDTLDMGMEECQEDDMGEHEDLIEESSTEGLAEHGGEDLVGHGDLEERGEEGTGEERSGMVQVIMEDDGQMVMPEGQFLQVDDDDANAQYIQVTGENGESQYIQLSTDPQTQIIQDADGNLIQITPDGQAQLIHIGNTGEGGLESLDSIGELAHDDNDVKYEEHSGETDDAPEAEEATEADENIQHSLPASHQMKTEEQHNEPQEAEKVLITILHDQQAKVKNDDGELSSHNTQEAPTVLQEVPIMEGDKATPSKAPSKKDKKVASVDTIDHSHPIALTANSVVVVGGKKCVLRVDPLSNRLVAFPVKPEGPAKRRGRPKKDANALTPPRSMPVVKREAEVSTPRGLSEQENSAAEGLLGLSDADGVRRSNRKKKKPPTLTEYETGKMEGEEEENVEEEDEEGGDDSESDFSSKPGRGRTNLRYIETTTNRMKSLLHSMGYPVKRGRGRPRRSPLPGTSGSGPTLLLPSPSGQGMMMAQMPALPASPSVAQVDVSTLQGNPPIIIQNADGTQTHIQMETMPDAITEDEATEEGDFEQFEDTQDSSQETDNAGVIMEVEGMEAEVNPEETTDANNIAMTLEPMVRIEESSGSSPTITSPVITNQSIFEPKILPILISNKSQTPAKIGLRTAESDLEKLKCAKCEFQAYYLQQYQDHLETEHGDQIFCCKCCPFKTFEDDQLKAHYKSLHPRCFCEECNFTSEHAYVVKRHVMRHKNQGCECEICGKKYKDPYILKMHIKMVHLPAEVLYGCNICSKKFTRKAHLKRHLRTHDPDRPFKCPQCDYRGCERSDITKHTLIHSEPKFTCHVCSKSFRHNKNLELHLKRHKGQRDYKCGVCDFYGYTFTDIRKHIERKHADAKQIVCRCGHTFKSEITLREHMKNCDMALLDHTLVIGEEEEEEEEEEIDEDGHTTISIPADVVHQLGSDGHIMLEDSQVNITVEQVSLSGHHVEHVSLSGTLQDHDDSEMMLEL